PATEEAARPPLRAIEELIRDDDVAGLVFLFEAADGTRGENELDAERLQAVDVRAEVQLRRRHAVAPAVPRQKRHALAAQGPQHVRRRRIAKRRRHHHFFAIGDIGHVVQAGAADDAYLRAL